MTLSPQHQLESDENPRNIYSTEISGKAAEWKTAERQPATVIGNRVCLWCWMSYLISMRTEMMMVEKIWFRVDCDELRLILYFSLFRRLKTKREHHWMANKIMKWKTYFNFHDKRSQRTTRKVLLEKFRDVSELNNISRKPHDQMDFFFSKKKSSCFYISEELDITIFSFILLQNNLNIYMSEKLLPGGVSIFQFFFDVILIISIPKHQNPTSDFNSKKKIISILIRFIIF